MNNLEMRKTIDVFKNGDLVEVRVLVGKKTYSGYFKSIDKLIESVKSFDKYAIYFVFNKINSACYSREQCEKLVENSKQTTSDNDIIAREWVLIDLDPKRSSGVSSTNEEKEKARLKANDIFKFLKDIGFSHPVCCDSGNGYHLMYKVNMVNDEPTKALIKSFLETLSVLFTDNEVDIDTSVFNSSRITKLYGTMARKGSNSEERPHRESKFINIPEEIKSTPKALFQKVVNMLPKPEQPTYKNNYNAENFDLDKFLLKHNIRVKNVCNNGTAKKYVLEECVFDSNHTSPDACIFQLSNGAIGYHCFHSSCSQYTWKDVRKKFEPDAYDKKFEFDKQRSIKPLALKRADISNVKPQEESQEKGDKFLQLCDIKAIDRSKIVSIPSGFVGLDKKIIGFNKGEITLWSGKNASGKSSVLNQIALQSVQKGFKVAIFSGELTPNRMKQWIQLQSAGRQYTKPTQYENAYFVPTMIGEKIDTWLKDKLYIYNNEYGTRIDTLLADIKEFIEKKQIDVLVIDNMMTLNLSVYDGDKYQQQTELILSLTDLVKKYNIHLHLVCHPRKSTEFLRKEDISGTADLTNAVDNLLIVHRVNNDFKTTAKNFLTEKVASQFYDFDNVIEVCKNRDLGVNDEMVGLFYEKESKRFLNEKFENIVLGWQDLGKQTAMPFDINDIF